MFIDIAVHVETDPSLLVHQQEQTGAYVVTVASREGHRTALFFPVAEDLIRLRDAITAALPAEGL